MAVKYQELPLSEVAANVTLEALKNAMGKDVKEVDWDGLKEDWIEYFEYIENKGVVLGLEIALKKWGDGGFGELMEEKAYYQDLVKEVESNF